MNNSYEEDSVSSWKLVGGVIIIILIVIISFSIFYWQKNNNPKSLFDKNNIVHTKDSDQDGLLDIDEEFYGTDPNVQDSDGDGHFDAAEILKNYNPLGEGKITGEYRDSLITKILDSNSLNDINSKRVFKNEISGYTINLFPGWVYVGSDEEYFFTYKENSKDIINVSVGKGTTALSFIGYAHFDELEKNNVDLNSFEVLSSIYCKFDDGEENKFKINGNDARQYDNGKKQCYIARVNYILDGKKIKTNIYVNFDFVSSDNKYKKIAEDFIKTYKDIPSNRKTIGEYLSSKDTATLTFCNKIYGLSARDRCFYDLSINTFDSAYCNLIPSREKREECTAKIGSPEKLCDVDNSSSCFIELAKAKKDEKYCEELENKSSCYSEIAILKNDINLCEKVVSSSGMSRDECIKKIALNLKDYSLCEKIINHSYLEYSCYIDIAVRLSDYRVCQNINNIKHESNESKEKFVTKCISDVAYQEEDFSICRQIGNASGVSECVARLKRKRNF